MSSTTDTASPTEIRPGSSCFSEAYGPKASTSSIILNSVLNDLTNISNRSPLFVFPSEETTLRMSELRILPQCVVFDLDDTLWCGDVDCTNGPPFYPFQFSSPSSFRKNNERKKTKVTSTEFVQSNAIGVDGVYDRSGAFRTGLNSIHSGYHRPALYLFNEVLAIISWLESKKEDVHICIASRTTTANWASEALKVFQTANGTPFADLISVAEMYDANKQKHISAILKKLKIGIDEVVFYDNLHFNLTDVEAIPYVNPITRKVDKEIKCTTMHTPRGLDWDNFIEGLIKHQTARMK